MIRLKRRVLKPWTVLIYANGNNDLEPEISASMLDLEKAGSGTNSNVVVQLARAPGNLVQLLRPHWNGPTGIDGDWNGVRRYCINKRGLESTGSRYNSSLLVNLGNINMAEPASLYDFIVWGIQEFPARHYMLIIVGHGAGFMGALTEYTGNCPQIMSIGGISAAINNATKKTGNKIDILMLDSCYMNMIEVVYELGDNRNAPGTLVVPEFVPLNGLPYRTLMEVLRGHGNRGAPKVLVNSMLNKMRDINFSERPVFYAINLNRLLLMSIKWLISIIARLVIKKNIDLKKYIYLSPSGFTLISLLKLVRLLHFQVAGYKTSIYKFLMEKCLRLLTISGNTSQIYVYYPEKAAFTHLAGYYLPFRFLHKNHWERLLPEKKTELRDTPVKRCCELPGAREMPLEGVVHQIVSQSAGLSLEEAGVIINKVGWANCPRLAKKPAG